MKKNVDALNPIQIGLTLHSTLGGQTGGPVCTWQFNLKFDLKVDHFQADAIQLLTNAGIDFDRLKRDGIDRETFARALKKTDLLRNDTSNWITFHGIYDYGYMVKLLSGQELPRTEQEFIQAARDYFPRQWDLKIIVQQIETLRGSSLQKLGNLLNVNRYGK